MTRQGTASDLCAWCGRAGARRSDPGTCWYCGRNAGRVAAYVCVDAKTRWTDTPGFDNHRAPVQAQQPTLRFPGALQIDVNKPEVVA